MTRDRDVNYKEFTHVIIEVRSPEICSQQYGDAERKQESVQLSETPHTKRMAGDTSSLKVGLLETHEESMSC